MSSMYERIVNRCKELGITPGGLCNSLGVRRGTMSELKSGRTQNLSAEKLSLFAKALNVSCDYLITGEEAQVSFSEDEMKLISSWRRASEEERENIAFILRHKGMKLSEAE